MTHKLDNEPIPTKSREVIINDRLFDDLKEIAKEITRIEGFMKPYQRRIKELKNQRLEIWKRTK